MLTCGGGGLCDILIDSDVYVYSGKQYKRAVRGLTLVYEAMMRYLMVSFFKWCEQKAHTISRKLWNQLFEGLMCRFLWGNTMDIHEEVLELI